MLYFLLFLYFLPIFIIYLLLCFTLPFVKIGPVSKCKGVDLYIAKDSIHADYVFLSKDIKDLFTTDKKYVKVGWGDRKIFLETKNWNELKLIDFMMAFFGLNKTVLRVEFLDNIPVNSKNLEINERQLEVIKIHIKDSHNGKLIKKKKEYYQIGDYYESNLKYNCFTNCNNWINYGLRLAQVTNRIWCPITYWL
jgi:uncharacterized protein (TIGR02117 family)